MKKLLIFFLIFLFSSNIFIGKAIMNQIVSGSNFNIYVSSGGALQFQHIAIPLIVESQNVTVTVASGTLNGTNGVLRMWLDNGWLTFTSQDSATLSCPLGAIFVNDSRSDSGIIASQDNVRIVWSAPSWNPVHFILGLIGFAMFVITPTYTVYRVKKKKDYYWLIWCFCFMALAYGLVWGWLSG